MMNMKEKYIKEVRPALKEKLGLSNDLAVPQIKKVVINVGFNPAVKSEQVQDDMARDLGIIAGQKVNPRQAKRAEAGFKIRQGMVIGLATTLRGQKMYDFLDRLVHIALPRGRDFRGLKKTSVDSVGNFNIGIKEHIIFPEISAENAKNIFSFQITITTTAAKQADGLKLFRMLGFPLAK